jgi:hypothetical protein
VLSMATMNRSISSCPRMLGRSMTLSC